MGFDIDLEEFKKIDNCDKNMYRNFHIGFF